MQRIAIGLSAALVAGLGSASPALAWNCRGHGMVAAVAWQNLTVQARTRVTALLQLNPDASTWAQHAGSLPADEAAFIQAACWPDDIKSEHGYQDPPHGQPIPNPIRTSGMAIPGG